MKRLKRIVVGALCLATVAVMIGCSSKSDEKVLRVGMECAYAPFNWTQTNDSNGAVKIKGSEEYAYGYDVMMAKKIADKIGYKLEVNKMEWDGLVPGVSSGKIDASIAGQSITAERLQAVDFSDVYYKASIVAITKKGTAYENAKSVQDLKGAVCTSQLNTVWYDILKQIPEADIKPAIDAVPALLCLLFISYSSANNPANIDPPAIPAVIQEAIPANNNATANIRAEPLPSNGFSIT
jgi:putative lysine transport system substrate-binding protein